jgi:hypothetical protein
MINYNIKKLAVSKRWTELLFNEKVSLINIELKKNEKTKEFEIFKINEDGQIILKIRNPIKSNLRGIILLDLEEQLKKNIDQGLTVWLEPIGDKSKLRNLRGVKFQLE